MGNSESAEHLLKQLAPVTQAKLRGTEIAADADRLRYLLTLPRDEQEGTVCRLSLGLTWEASLPKVANNRESGDQGSMALVAVSGGAERGGSGVCGADDKSGASTAIGMRESPPSDPDPVPQVIRVAVSELRPNSVNATIFSDSLADEQLRDLADHLLRYGQQEPIRVDPAHTILDGERRWRALMLIGAKYADVVVDRLQRSRDELEDLVIDAFSLKRKPSLEEQLRVYDVAVRSYTRRHGRVVGRPRKLDKNLSGFWSPKQIRTAAAKAAGFGSREPVRQALRVMKEADEETKSAMLSGRLNIGAAYATLLPSEDDDDDASTEGAGTLPDVPHGAAATANEAAPQTDKPGQQGQSPPAPDVAAVQPGRAPLPDHASRSVTHEQLAPDSADEGKGEAAPASPQLTGADPSTPSSSKADERVHSTQTSEKASPASGRRDRTTAKTESSERRSYLRARATVVRFIAGLRERDDADARRERDEAVDLIDAAAYGAPTADGRGTPEASGRGPSSSGDVGEDTDEREGTEADILHEEFDEDLNVDDDEGLEETGDDEGLVEQENDDDLDETEDDDDLDETEDDDDLDETEDDDDLDETEDDDDLDETEDDEADETEQNVAADEDQEDDSVAEHEGDTGKRGDLDVPKALSGETYDYSDYYEDNADDEDGDRPEDADDDDLADSEEDGSEDEETDEEDALKDPEDAEVDRIIGRSRARRI